MAQRLLSMPWEGLVAQLAPGSREFVEQLMQEPKSAVAGQELRAAMEERPDFAEVRKVIEGLKGEPWARFEDRHGDWGRDLALYLGWALYGLTLPELGAQTGGRSAMALKRLRGRLARDKTLAGALHQARRALTSEPNR